MKKIVLFFLLIMTQLWEVHAIDTETDHDNSLDCRKKEDRVQIVINHSLRETEFNSMVIDTNKFQVLKASYIRSKLKSFFDLFWMDCEKYRIRLDDESSTPGVYIHFDVIEVGRPPLVGYYHLGFFRGLFEKYPNLEEFRIYIGKNEAGKPNFPFKVNYYDATGVAKTDYYDFSQEDPN